MGSGDLGPKLGLSYRGMIPVFNNFSVTRQSVANEELIMPIRNSIMAAERFKKPRRSSIISDTFKLQQVEHRIDGHERGNLT